ncbi:hypothetical protein DEO72_LG9g564 [Vigna unguiculata]|uniref:GRF-type domain-containing protein n=1 Tax=Vigna unguiculata TaxID=3917 RepID=A0A4D6MVP2_VIGUN|nr:hypothetical protein DEO72_LG9g564 [Vigna unguiculata]
MSRSEGCSCSSWGSQKQSVSSTGGSYRVLGECPLCFCGENAVLRVAKTVRNAGKQFWGCPKYKVGRSGGNEVFKGCNYFKWLNEDNGDEKDATIGRQRRKIYTLEKAIAISDRWFVS